MLRRRLRGWNVASEANGAKINKEREAEVRIFGWFFSATKGQLEQKRAALNVFPTS